MSAARPTIGNQIDADLRGCEPRSPITRRKRRDLRTVDELLKAIDEDAPTLPVGMLRTTARHVSNFLNVPLEQLEIDVLVGLDPDFRNYLKERRYKEGSVRSYSNFVSILLKAAKELGWEPRQSQFFEAWKAIADAMPPRSYCRGIIAYSIRHGKAPSRFCDDDLDAWGQTLLDNGRSYIYVTAVKGNFRRALVKSGFSTRLPHLCCTSHKRSTYAIPVECFPATLRAEVEKLLKWKQDEYAEGRPRRQRLRPISANKLATCIARLYGVVTRIEKWKNVKSLVELVTKESLVHFIKWSLNERKVKSRSFAVGLSMLYAALKWNPAYQAEDLGWFRTLLSEIQPDSESERRERKLNKYLPYEVIRDIPAMIRERREELGVQLSERQLAFLVHDELLVLWLVTFLWRQRNIRECRIGENLYKAPIPPLVNMAIPEWARESIKSNPRAEFWQFRFCEQGTKTGNEVRSILPHRLVPLLEEYLERHRPAILRGFDPGNLFLNRNGGPLTVAEVSSLISNLTLRYAGRRVTPHLFRDIFAYWWLEHHPEDYLTVSKMLWHKDINTTLRIYGSRFDESHGLRRVEELLDRGEDETKQASRDNTQSLTDRIEQLEKQLTHRTLEPHSEQSQIQLRIQPGKVKSVSRKTGSGVA